MADGQSAWISVGNEPVGGHPSTATYLSYDPGDQLPAFTEAAARLTSQLNSESAFRDLKTGVPCLAADLVLEGGGVKGIALAGAVLALDKAGYRFPRVAGTSAGAIAAALIAAIQHQEHPMSELGTALAELEFSRFMEAGRIETWAAKVGGRIEQAVDGGELMHHMGLYSGDYLYDWLGPVLKKYAVSKFEDLAIPVSQDPGMDQAMKDDPRLRYSLVVHTSDITRGLLVRVPWNTADYGIAPDDFSVLDAVRASMSIPFFFEPFRMDSSAADVEVPQSDGTTQPRHFDGGSVTWVDGGMLSNFPIGVFDRTDGQPARWPTFGIKLSAAPVITPADVPAKTTAEEAMRCVHTMMNEWDRYATQDSDADRIIFVDSAGIKATDFHLDSAKQQTLFTAGADAAVKFVIALGK